MTQILRLMRLMTGDEKHDVAAASTLDVIRVLYERVLDVSPETVGDPDRDRFYLSKGHGPMAYYAVLADRGFFPESWLAGLDRLRLARSATTRTATWSPASRSPPARSGTVSRSRSAPRSDCGRRGSSPASSCSSATPSSTRAATTRRSSSRPHWRWTR